MYDQFSIVYIMIAFHMYMIAIFVQVEDCGLFIDRDHPFIAASPDGLVTCSCCGEGLCEVKVGTCTHIHQELLHLILVPIQS